MNTSIHVLHVAPKEIENISLFIAALNKLDVHQCLHCDTGYDGIAREVAEIVHNPQSTLLKVVCGDTLIGVIGCELNEEATHARLRGPFIDDVSWTQTAQLLYDTLQQNLPETVRTVLSFPNTANTRSCTFYTDRGFEHRGTVHIYIAPAPGYMAQPSVSQEYDASLFPQFEAMYTEAFPLAVETAEEIISRLGNEVKMFVSVDSDLLEGFVVISLNDAPVEGFIELLAVHPKRRGRGIGETLLRTALFWCFQIQNMPQAGLCVRDNNTNARSLYERAGFGLFASGADLRYVPDTVQPTQA